jgi:4-alpha-glucanotransferase
LPENSQNLIAPAGNDEAEQYPLPDGRRAGVCLHISSLPGRYGVGELGAAAHRFIDTLAGAGLGVWQFLPTGPTAYGDSPYQPLSSFAGNELFIDIDELISLNLLRPEEVHELEALPQDTVDYGALIPIKARLLRLAAHRFEARASTALKAARDDFVTRHDKAWLHDYALFRYLKTRHAERPWQDWESKYVHRDPKALRSIARTGGAEIADTKVLQFLFHHQWQQLRRHANERGVWLFGDMPICIALDSADAWANRDLLLIDKDGRPDVVAGVPPDYFSRDGQLWGNPLYNWPMHAADNYRWWIDRLSASLELADLVRIDHFRGFESYWSVPAGSPTARTGTWEPGPGDALFDAVREALGLLPIVAEDLGVITPEVEALRDRHRIPGMVVLQFDVADEQFDLDEIRHNCVCYTGTHDNDTTIGWFNGSPDDIRPEEEIAATQRAGLALTNGTPDNIHIGMIQAAFSSPAWIAIAPLQDYLGLGSEARLNTPGKPGGNWRWRVTNAQLAGDFCERTGKLVTASGRWPAPLPILVATKKID